MKEKDIEQEEIKNENPDVETEKETQEETVAEGEEQTSEEEELSPVEKLEEENAKLKDQLLRTIAEFENYKKRTHKEKQELIFNGGERTITAILPVIDDFERALNDKTEDPESIKEGYSLIYKKFIKALEALGVKKIETENQDFNVDFHEAVAMVPGMGDDNKGKVIDCIQSGYTLNDKVIRHAKVAVGQ